MATTETNANRTEDVVNRVVEAFNQHSVQKMTECYSPDAVILDPQHPDGLKGREEIDKDFQDFIKAFPDLKMNLDQTMTKDRNFAMEFSMSGTHKGPLVSPDGEIPATNRKVSMRGSVFGRLDNQNRITEERRHYDLAGLLSQIGKLQLQ